MALSGCASDDDGTDDGGDASGGETSTTDGEDNSGGSPAASGGAMSSGGASSSSGGDTMAGGASGGDGGDCESIVEIAAGDPNFSSLVAAVTKAGLVEALEGDGLTVFAPTNDAFADLFEALGLQGLDDLSVEQLTPLLTYHVLGAEVNKDAAIEVAEGAGSAESLGGTIQLSLDGSSLVLDADEFSATVTSTDIEACNGLIHVIDGVIVPSILDIVATQPSFSSLLGLVQASSDPAGLSAALDGPASAIVDTLDPGAFTLFAPSNEAIDALSATPDADALTSILQYHVYAADEAVLAATALTLEDAEIEMLSSDPLTVDGGTGVTLTDGQGNDSSVITTDIYASNGVIHRIDGVLLP
jgi:transforming growth factor-beta-induced protein